MNERYYDGVKHIEKVYDVAEVNKRLERGEKILAIKEESEELATEKGVSKKQVVVFVMGVVEEEKAGERKEIWKKNEDSSEWASASDVPDLAEKLKNGPFVENGYLYWLSKNGKYVHKKLIEKSNKSEAG